MRLSRARITCDSLSRFILKMPIIRLGRTLSEEEEEEEEARVKRKKERLEPRNSYSSFVLKVAQNSFQHLDFYGSLQHLFIT